MSRRVEDLAGRVAELFAGVGGFRLALEGHAPTGMPGSGWSVVWSNQWEPATRNQHASDCYRARFGDEHHWNEDIAKILDRVEAGDIRVPQFDLLVGGFPCQDYSVARTLNQAAGIQGKKGVLWWEIYRMLKAIRPRFVFLENVDRLLKSPAAQRGRDFAVMLHCLNSLRYAIEWRVVNAADYGFPQRRRRVYIVGELVDVCPTADPLQWMLHEGVLAHALPASAPGGVERLPMRTPADYVLPADLVEVSDRFSGEFRNAGFAFQREIWTLDVAARSENRPVVLGDILLTDEDVARPFYIPRSQISRWRYLKGAKREPRVAAKSGFRYFYSEGAIAFPDRLDRPSRTILTGEGGSSPSRSKHVVRTSTGRYRRLTPVELERLNGFPDGWTAGMRDTRRAFMMGNALVVGVIRKIGTELARRYGAQELQQEQTRLSVTGA